MRMALSSCSRCRLRAPLVKCREYCGDGRDWPRTSSRHYQGSREIRASVHPSSARLYLDLVHTDRIYSVLLHLISLNTARKIPFWQDFIPISIVSPSTVVRDTLAFIFGRGTLESAFPLDFPQLDVIFSCKQESRSSILPGGLSRLASTKWL